MLLTRKGGAVGETCTFRNRKTQKTKDRQKMATTKIDLSVVMLKKSLAANGLPQYGTKEQMLARLLGGGEKKKPGPKPNGDGTLPKKRKATSTSKAKPAALLRRPRVAQRPPRHRTTTTTSVKTATTTTATTTTTR
jgi:hypothetical protein